MKDADWFNSKQEVTMGRFAAFPFVALLALLAVRGVAISDNCEEYADYYSGLDYCSDPLYWSHYKVSTNVTFTAAEAVAKAEYESIRDGIYYNTELAEFTKVDRWRLADCMGMAHRVACHRAIPRCSHGEDRTLCKGMCKTFHDRCTVDGVDFIVKGMGKTYDLYTCEGLNDHACSPASRGARLAGVAVGAIVLAASALVAAL